MIHLFIHQVSTSSEIHFRHERWNECKGTELPFQIIDLSRAVRWPGLDTAHVCQGQVGGGIGFGKICHDFSSDPILIKYSLDHFFCEVLWHRSKTFKQMRVMCNGIHCNGSQRQHRIPRPRRHVDCNRHSSFEVRLRNSSRGNESCLTGEWFGSECSYTF